MIVSWLESPSTSERNALTVNLPADPEDHVAAVVTAWAGQGLTISDRRSKMVFDAGEGRDVIAYYAALCGLMNRLIEAQVKGVLLNLQETYDEGRALADAGLPAQWAEWAQVGGDDPGHLPHIPFEAGTLPGPEAVSLIRYAARLRMVPPGRAKPALLCFALMAGIRDTRRERFPFLSTGLEPEPQDRKSPGQGIDLEGIRQRARDHRRVREPSNDEIVEPPANPEGYEKLARANATPIESVLLRLGCSATDDEPGLWNCPRPGRHRNRDAKPSLRIRETEAQCAGCDAVPLTPTQLVADTLRITPDEAAAFIVDLKCVTGRPALGYRSPELVAPPPPGTLVTAHIYASRRDRFACVIYDAGVGYRREAVIWRPDTANLPAGVAPLQLKSGDAVTALTVEFQPATPGRAGHWQLSVTAPQLAARAMATQVPEIIEGSIIVKDVARVAGARTKVAVAPTQRGVDARGACIGRFDSRHDVACRLVNRPNGHEIMDIIAYSSERQKYLDNAMDPAQVVEVLIRGGNAIVAVPPQQLHNGIGGGGLNAQLAGRLTGLYVRVIPMGTDLDAALTRLEDRYHAENATGPADEG